MSAPPILGNKDVTAPSVFASAALLREARRQKELAPADVPSVCILDPDGDILRLLNSTGQARRFDAWPCYHTELNTFELGGETVGIVGCVVGAPFSVLVAEELFACGCRFLLSLTSAGQIVPVGPRPISSLSSAPCATKGPVITTWRRRNSRKQTRVWSSSSCGPSSANDCPCSSGRAGRRTHHSGKPASAIDHAKAKGILAVEMEAAALYAFA